MFLSFVNFSSYVSFTDIARRSFKTYLNLVFLVLRDFLLQLYIFLNIIIKSLTRLSCSFFSLRCGHLKFL